MVMLTYIHCYYLTDYFATFTLLILNIWKLKYIFLRSLHRVCRQTGALLRGVLIP